MTRFESATRLRAGVGEDRYGNVERDWSTPDELVLRRVRVAPRFAPEENQRGREGVPIGLTLYLRRDAEVVATDRIRVRGDLYRVDGEPAVWPEGLAVHLERVEG